MSQKTLLLVNGEDYWQAYFPQFNVRQVRVQSADFLLKDGRLWVVDGKETIQPDAIFWRVGAIKPSARQEVAMRMIQLSGLPCINPANSLMRGYDRLAMLAEIQACGLPIVPFQVASSPRRLEEIAGTFPFVVKAGNYHGGYGKVLVRDAAQWQDVRDLLFMTEEYVTVEPFIRYERDLRYLAVGDRVWAMQRRSGHWKVNVGRADYIEVEPEPEWVTYTQALRQHIGAQMVAIDVLEEADGTRYVLEYNDIPGISGFPTEVKRAVADLVARILG
ncbi:MAG: hypothetical protein U0176_12655 [Bacteroidia bacterium]